MTKKEISTFRVDQRRSVRTPVQFVTNLLYEGGVCLPGKILNISDRGFMVECEKGFVEGEIIAIHLVGFGNHMAEVKWSIGRRAGAEFMRYLEIQEYQICLDLMAGAGNA